MGIAHSIQESFLAASSVKYRLYFEVVMAVSDYDDYDLHTSM